MHDIWIYAGPINTSNSIVSAGNFFFNWVSNRRNNCGNEENVLMTQLNVTSQPILSHVAARAEFEQTRKPCSSLTTSDEDESSSGRLKALSGCCACASVCGGFCFVLCYNNLLVSSAFFEERSEMHFCIVRQKRNRTLMPAFLFRCLNVLTFYTIVQKTEQAAY